MDIFSYLIFIYNAVFLLITTSESKDQMLMKMLVLFIS